MAASTIRAMASTRKTKLGHFVVEFATPGIGHICKSAGCDFVLLDMEHSGFSFDTLKSMLRYMEAAEMPTIVRSPSKDYTFIARACDMGAEGLMLPMVANAEEAKRIVSYMKYPPVGIRGVAPQVAHDRYRPGPVVDKLKQANKKTVLFTQIETQSGLDNVEEIAAVPGVDCLWIGHFDLSASMGIPGEFDNPRYTQAVSRIIAAAQANKRALGHLVPTVAEGVRLNELGFDFICYSGDIWVLHNALAAAVGELRQQCKGG
jgi:2-dehydro-3-deoxyglucarate aldolase/4-hydroxy-2-oxoheptanedioate aldolase